MLIIFASQRVVDEYLRLDIDLEGKGEGLLITAGKCVEVVWETTDGRIGIELADGTKAPLNTGKTHITVFDASHKSGITIK